MTHDYTRNGTTDLFAALNVKTGEVLTECRKRHTGDDVRLLHHAHVVQTTRESIRLQDATSGKGVKGHCRSDRAPGEFRGHVRGEMWPFPGRSGGCQ